MSIPSTMRSKLVLPKVALSSTKNAFGPSSYRVWQIQNTRTPWHYRSFSCSASSRCVNHQDSKDTRSEESNATFSVRRPLMRRPDPFHLRPEDSGSLKIMPTTGVIEHFDFPAIPGSKLPFQVPFAFLRDACKCSLCVDSSTQQKLFSTADIPLDVTARTIDRSEDQVRISWKNDVAGYSQEHISEFSNAFIKSLLNYTSRRLHRYDTKSRTLWSKDSMTEKVNAGRQSLSYNEYMRDEKKLAEFLLLLHRDGLVFLNEVPDDEHAVERIGQRIGVLKDTFYGRTWDVKSVEEPKNVAYTNRSLGLHMDLLYLSEPPGIQLLHCLRNDAEGGDSLFADSFSVVDELFQDVTIANILLTFPVTWQYRNDSQHYYASRPTVELETYRPSKGRSFHKNLKSSLKAVNWSPPFQAPFEIDVGMKDGGLRLRKWMRAAKAFQDLVESRRMMLETRPEKGQCVIFNNRRVLHGRTAFQVGSGERWLKGAYLDLDTLQCRMRVLNEKHDPKSL